MMAISCCAGVQRELVSGMNPYDLHLLPDNLVYR
jgi:hypothetical protein